MCIISLDKSEYWIAIIDWKAPRKWYMGDGVYLDDEYKNKYGIYRFERRHGKQIKGRENLYIGIAYNQTFDQRLHQCFHENKIANHAKHCQIWVSLGEIDLKDTIHTRNRYEEIESVLIYFTQPKLNEKKKNWCPSCQFIIQNKGYRGPLPKYIKFPVAEIRN